MTFPTYSMFLPLKRKPHPSYMSYDLIDMCEKYGKSNVSTKSCMARALERIERKKPNRDVPMIKMLGLSVSD
jgi:hypothetical protein